MTTKLKHLGGSAPCARCGTETACEFLDGEVRLPACPGCAAFLHQHPEQRPALPPAVAFPDPVDVIEDTLAADLGLRRHPEMPLEDWRRLRVQFHRRADMSIARILSTALLATAVGILSFVVAAAAQPIFGNDLEAAELVAGLPWAFEVAVEAPAEAEDGSGSAAVKVTRYRFKSTEPYSETAAGKVYLRLQLTTSEHGDVAAAEAAFDELLASADPDTGLSYAWDDLLLSGAVLYHLHAPCLFSEENFQRLVSRLEAAVQRQGQARSPRAFACRCGGGCREVAAAPEAPSP